MRPPEPNFDETYAAFAKACAQVAANFNAFFPPPTRWQRLTWAVDDAKESMIAGLRACWLYLVAFWLGIAVGGFAGWIEWGPR